MPTYTQANQPLAIDTPLGADKLLLVRVQGTEAISRLFHLTLDCLSLEPVSFDDLLGKPATVRLSIPGCPQRHINSIVNSLEQGHQSQGPAGGVTFYRYRVELSPRMWLCGLRRQSRVFQQVAVPDILHAILHNEWGLAVEPRLTGTYPARDFCVQYRETDLAFVRRLMEEEGICFYFEHTTSSHTLVLADGPDGHPSLAQQSSLLFDAAAGGRRPEGRVTAWAKKQSLRSCKVTLRDHCFQLPSSTLEASSTIQETVQVGQKQHTLKHSVTNGGNDLLEYYDHLGGYAWRFDGVSPEGSNQPEKVQGLFQENQRVSHLRMEAEATAALTIDGASLCGHLLPGRTFSLDRHFDGNGGYLITQVEHKADLESAYLSDAAEAGLIYENRFQAIPAGLPFRPALETARPRTYGVVTALVVGPKGGDIFVDKYGRVKVKFLWDREEATGSMNSCWVRVGQVWAGNRWGAFFWPRVGHEVIVSFEDGNPDRPLITGSVYNENHMPPFELPANKTLAGVKSNTSSAGGSPSDPLQNYSGFVINDDPGKEHIEIHGEKHIAFYAEETERHMVDGPHRHNVNGIHSVHVGALPGGSGSGGGLDPDHPYLYSADTKGGKIGIAFTSTCGIAQDVILGAYSMLTVGSNINVVVNPLGMAADLGMAIPGTGVLTGLAAGAIAGLGAPALGYTNITMGSQTEMIYGSYFIIHRGAKAPIEEVGSWSGGELEPGEAIYAKVTLAMLGLSAAFMTAGTIWACMDSYGKSQAEWVSFMGGAAELTAALEIAEVFRATFNQVAKAKEAATAATALTEDAEAVEAIAETVTNFFESDPVDLNTAKLIKGSTSEYNDGTRLVGGKEGVFLFAGNEAEEQSAISMDPNSMALALGVPQEGPRITMYSIPTGQKIMLMNGPPDVGSAIVMTPESMTLSFGPSDGGSSIIMNETGVTIQAGTCKIILTVEGTIELVTPAAALSLADGVAELSGNESVSIKGNAIELTGDDSAKISSNTISIVGDTTMSS